METTVAPTNPYALSSAAHLSTLAASPDAAATKPGAPPTILQTPSYDLADPEAPALFLRQLDAQKLAAVQHGPGADVEFGAKPAEGIAGESQQAREHKSLLAAGGSLEETGEGAATGAEAPAAAGGSGTGGAAAGSNGERASAAAIPQAIEVSHADAQQMAAEHA